MNNGTNRKRGCPGAVNSHGMPRFELCTNTGFSKGRFPWWNACCDWKNGRCVPKESGNNL